MKKVLLLIILFGISNTLSSMETMVQLPSADTIAKRSDAAGLYSLIETTGIDKTFGDKKMDLAEIVTKADQALTFYHQKMNYHTKFLSKMEHPILQKREGYEYAAKQEQLDRKCIIHILLLEHQTAIQELKKRGILD